MATKATNLYRELSRAVDPIRFAQSLGINPDKWQSELLLSTHKQICLNCCRQAGKSEAVSIAALYEALNVPNSLILIISPSLRQSGELFKKVVSHYRYLHRPIKATIEAATTLQLNNGSRIVSLPGSEKTIRGFSSPSLILVDEAARVEDEIFYASLRPMLAVSGGRIIILSTPAGRRGFFADVWHDIKGWQKIKITATECARISSDFLESEKKALGNRVFEQEYFGAFHLRGDSLFSWEQIQGAFSDNVKEIHFAGLEEIEADGSEYYAPPSGHDLNEVEVEEINAEEIDVEFLEPPKPPKPRGRFNPLPIDHFSKGV